MMLTFGAILFGSTQLIPQMMQQVFGYTATEAGLVITIGGIGALVAMPLTGLLTGRVQTRILLGVAFIVQAYALWNLSGFETGVPFGHAAMARFYQAVALPFLFVPITAQSYAGLEPQQYGQASAILNVARNLGGSIGISSAQALLEQREQFHQSRLVEGLNPLNPVYVDGLGQIGRTISGGPLISDADTSRLANLYALVEKQAAMLSYIDVFHTLMIIVFIVIPFAILLKPTRGQGGH
jgi:DHA2 family multidrug resistance protein